MKNIFLLCFLFCLPMMAQENQLEPKLEHISWISGTWHGEAFGGQTEEIWSEPSGGSMMASFKLINDEKVTFYEIEVIREIENSLVLQLKHFGPDLKGWETKDTYSNNVSFIIKNLKTNNQIVDDFFKIPKEEDL